MTYLQPKNDDAMTNERLVVTLLVENRLPDDCGLQRPEDLFQELSA